jgi:hypothetical protein
MQGDELPDQLIMTDERGTHVIGMLFPQAGTTFHVGEKESDSPPGKLRLQHDLLSPSDGLTPPLCDCIPSLLDSSTVETRT